LEAAFRRVVASGHFIMGPEVEAFEREVAAYLGVRHAMGVNSGTDAIVLALRALGIGPGDEVIVPSFTFFATAESVNAVGATPVFADIEPDTFNLSPASAAAAIGPRTRAIIPVHLFGHPADLDALGAVARDRNLVLVEDVAQAFGASWRGRKAGTVGAVGAYSFFPSKNLGCLGDGGLVATDDDKVADAVRMLRAHGSRRKYFNEQIGYNSRLDALQAAMLRAKLPRVDGWNEGRRQVAARYRELLAGVPGLVLPTVRPGAEHVYHQYTVRVTGGRRDALKAALEEVGIDTMVYYPKAMHQLPVYAGAAVSLPEVEAATREVLSLPMWPLLELETQERIAEQLRLAANRAGLA
jgi:dTDP-4-amino-4,6-dideoxygalactose transaminase